MLRLLSSKSRMTQAEVGALFGVTPQAVGFALDRHGLWVALRVLFQTWRRVQKWLGFSDRRAYFRARGPRPFRLLSEEVGVSVATIGYVRERWIEAWKAARRFGV